MVWLAKQVTVTIRPMQVSSRLALPICIAIFILGAVTLVTRLPSPWRTQVTNDEMLHLESYRNRYGTEDIYPLFLQRLKSSVSPQRYSQIERVYRSSPIVQRIFLMLPDGHPPGFPLTMEVTQAVTDSSLMAIRFISVLGSIAAVLLMFEIGRRLGGPSLGLWSAGLLSVGFLPIAYAGIGRPYATAQAMMLLVVLAYIREHQLVPRSPKALLGAALLAQAFSWQAWPAVGALVAVSLIERYRTGQTVKQLLKNSWWYIVGSIALLAYMKLQLTNPTLARQLGVSGMGRVWPSLRISEPLANLGSLDARAMNIAAVVFIALVICGLISAMRRPHFGIIAIEQSPMRVQVRVVAPPPQLLLDDVVERPSAVGEADLHAIVQHRPGKRTTPDVSRETMMRWGLIVATFISLILPLVSTPLPRFQMVFLLLPTLFAAVSLRRMCRTENIAAIAAAAMLLLMGTLAVLRPLPIYQYVMDTDSDYAAIAADLKRQIQPTDIWAAYPANKADCIYRDFKGPAPFLPTDDRDLQKFLLSRPPNSAAVLLLGSFPGDVAWLRDPAIQSLPHQTYLNGVTLLRLPPGFTPPPVTDPVKSNQPPPPR